MRTDTAIERPSDLTAEWLATVLHTGPVTDFDYQRIGTGQMSECYRVTLAYEDGAAGPPSVVLKVAAGDPTSRQTGLALGLYEREVRFYTDIAPRLAGPVATCHHAAFDPGTGVFDLLLDDAHPAVTGDEIAGASAEQAELAVRQLACMQGPLLGDAGLAESDWLNREAPINGALITQLYQAFADRYGPMMTDEQRAVCERLIAGFDDYLAAEAAREPHGLVHGDFRLDNMLFGTADTVRPLTVVDWQTVGWGPAMTDLSYFLGCALPVEARRDLHERLLRAYHDELGPSAALTLDEVRDGVRRQSFAGVMMVIVSSMLVERTERGDRMFLTMLERHCTHVLDTGALEVLGSPAPHSDPPPLPQPGDELAHPPTDEALWNESWYFDFSDADHDLGGWVRLGLYPNEHHAWINVLLCGPGRPTVALLDFEVPTPADPYRVATDRMELAHTVIEPLRSYRVTARGRGEAHDDPSAVLRGEPGRPVEVEMDLVWTTVAVPYQYRITTRYEIACTVSGTVTVDGHTVTVEAVPGQRDHSWAPRDWWAMDWAWSALHLDDGTHLHGVEVRIPGLPSMSVGYDQHPGAGLVELTTVVSRERFADNGLPTGAQLELEPGGLRAEVQIVGHAPVALRAADGRVAEFPRAWVQVRLADGRTGCGWMEWNRNR